jgi:hypothetical protein
VAVKRNFTTRQRQRLLGSDQHDGEAPARKGGKATAEAVLAAKPGKERVGGVEDARPKILLVQDKTRTNRKRGKDTRRVCVQKVAIVIENDGRDGEQ